MMFGLAVMAVFALYLAVSTGMTLWVIRWARRSRRRAWFWGGITALAMYHLVFWDFIPTLVVHHYYCATEAGFWVYKTPEQWEQENPQIFKYLNDEHERWVKSYVELWKENHPAYSTRGIEEYAKEGTKARKQESLSNGCNRYWMNSRLYYDKCKSILPALGIFKTTYLLIDSPNNDQLANGVDFSRGGGAIGLSVTLGDLRRSILFGWGDGWCPTKTKSFANQFFGFLDGYRSRWIQ